MEFRRFGRPSLLALLIVILATGASSFVARAARSGAAFDALSGETAAEPIKVWVYFADHGERAAGELTRMLDGVTLTERSLDRRARRSRLRPVDAYDLPVCTAYVDAVRSLGCGIHHSSKYLNAVSAYVTRGELDALSSLRFVRKIERVRTATRSLPGGYDRPEQLDNERGGPLTPPFSTNGPVGAAAEDSSFYGVSDFQVRQIDIPPLHDLGYHGKNVLIAMLDSGFRRINQALTHVHVVAEWDFINNDPVTSQEPNDPVYQDSHGSLALGTIAAYLPGVVIGPAWAADYLLAKTERYNRELQVEEDDYVRALEWADSLGADIVSSSLGYFTWYTYQDMDGNTAVTTRAADIAASRGILVVTAAGNEGPLPWPGIIAPADADSVIAVGAADSTGEVTWWSSRGPTYDGRIKPDVLAMGEIVASVRWSDTTGLYPFSGTSASTPLVSGACALILQMNPDWSPLDVRDALRATASYSQDPNNDHGWGLVDAYRAARFRSALPVVFEMVPGSCDHPFQPRKEGVVPAVVFGSSDVSVGQIDVSSLRVLGRAAPVKSHTIDLGAADDSGRKENTPPCSHGSPDGIEDLMVFFAAPDIAEGLGAVEPGDVVPLELTGSLLDGTRIEGEADITVVGGAPATESPPGGPDGRSAGQAIRTTSLGNAVPNPFNPVTRIPYTLARDGWVRISIYDVTGRLVERLFDGPKEAGDHAATWDARDSASGVYFYELETDSYRASRRIVILK